MSKTPPSRWIGHIGLLVLFLGGVWLLIAPVWVGFQSDKLASRLDQWAGAAVIVLSVATLFLEWSMSLSEAVHRHHEQQNHQKPTSD
ncbi:MAG: hypothetical protein OWU33_10005 [Firmicutes bacterium]|nr:hypothetical protein [Bacillota bacterium]